MTQRSTRRHPNPRGARRPASSGRGAWRAVEQAGALLAAAWLLVACGPGGADVAMAEGVRATRAGEHARATASYREALRLEPRKVGVYTNLSVAALADGRLTAAIALLQEELERHGGFPPAVVQRAAVLVGLGRPAEAATALEQLWAPPAEDEAPRPPLPRRLDAAARLVHALATWARGDAAEDVDRRLGYTLEAADQAAPTPEGASENWAAWEEADVAAIRQAALEARLALTLAEEPVDLAVLRLRLDPFDGRFQTQPPTAASAAPGGDASASAEAAAPGGPTKGRADSSPPAEADAAARQLRLHRMVALAEAQLALRAHANGASDAAQALTRARAVVSTLPTSAVRAATLAHLDVRLGEFESAKASLAACGELDPDPRTQASALRLEAHLAAKDGRWPDARKALDGAVAALDTLGADAVAADPSLWLDRAVAMARTGDLEGARLAVAGVLRDHPDHPRAMELRALLR